MSILQIRAAVKILIDLYRAFVKNLPLSVRPCACGHPFRHRHGSYERYVVVGVWQETLSILRLKCPRCKRTEALVPHFMPRHSPYPWILRQEALCAYAEGEQGYRPTAATWEVEWQTLWRWARELARRLPAITGALMQGLLAAPGRASERALQALTTVVTQHPMPRARAPTREVLRRYLPPACATALELWEAGTLRGLSWGAPDSQHALAFLMAVAALSRPT
jgi:transposase-like protein